MSPRPLSLAVASGLIAIIGVGVGFVGLFLLAIASGGIPLLDSGGGIVSVVGFLGMTAIASSVFALVASVALWQHRAWGWAASLAIAVAGVVGAVIALGSSGAQAPIQVGLVLTLVACGLLVAPGTRRAAGIG
jgi:hypothetical protein